MSTAAAITAAVEDSSSDPGKETHGGPQTQELGWAGLGWAGLDCERDTIRVAFAQEVSHEYKGAHFEIWSQNSGQKSKILAIILYIHLSGHTCVYVSS